MKFKIHYEINGEYDYFIVSGETIEEVQKNAHEEIGKRDLNMIKNNVFSERI